MGAAGVTLGEYTQKQLTSLHNVIGTAENDSAQLLDALLGTAAGRKLVEPPGWPSDIADDATPVEFSLAFNDDGAKQLRILGETSPGTGQHTDHRNSEELLEKIAGARGLPLDRFHAIRDLFLPVNSSAIFSLWFSFIFRPDTPPDLKVYLNPSARGPEHNLDSVAEGLERLGLTGAYRTIEQHALRRGERDRFAFFALDISAEPRARVKVYIAHAAATADDAMAAAEGVPGVDSAQVRRFCQLTGGDTEVFDGRPLVSSYAFSNGDTAVPSNYSIYVPLRSYVTDDEVARNRVAAAMAERGTDPSLVDDALRAVAQRPLSAGPGLLAHTSLRLGGSHSGVTTYLSSEAYQRPSAERRVA